MEDQFYSRTTGRFKTVHPSSYGTGTPLKKDQESVYSLEESGTDNEQYPFHTLTAHQLDLISKFIKGLTSLEHPLIDVKNRSIHRIGLWRVDECDTTVSCTVLQPHVTTATVTLKDITYDTIKMYSSNLFPNGDSRSVSVNRTTKYGQLMGKFSLPCLDMMLENNSIKSSQFNIDNAILSKTQMLFCVAQGYVVYECKLTHESCKIISDSKPQDANISAPVQDRYNYSFRSGELRAGCGTGPSMTVHTSGTMQFQGNPDSIYIVTSCFRRCIDHVMKSRLSMRFLRSLSVIRVIDVP